MDGDCEAGDVALSCSDGNPCTSDSCDGATGCVFENNSLECDDGSVCTTDACDPDAGCTNTVIDCVDGNACTEDSCDAIEGCVFNPVVCDDGDACTQDGCEPETGCIFGDSNCDDADACTTDTCDADGDCIYEKIDCSDDSACTQEACDSELGCQVEEINCDDNLACTVDTCDADTGCVNTAVVCPDASQCNESLCDENTGECSEKPLDPGAPCNDGDECTVGDTCVGGDCLGKVLECDDDNECTTDSCTADGCVFTNADGLACDEDNPCTILGSCSEGTCEVVDACDDFDDCTLDSCSPDGSCSYEPNPECVDPQCEGKGGGEVCDDGDGDTSADMCIGGQCIGFAYNAHSTDPAFGSLSFDEIGHANGVWTTAITTFGSQFNAAALIDISLPGEPATFDGTTLYGPVYTSVEGRFAVTNQGDLYELDDGVWSDESLLNELLADSGIGSLQDLYVADDAEETLLWVVGRDGNDEYIRRCTNEECVEQVLDWNGFGNSPPLPRAITGYKDCGLGVCNDILQLGVDQGGGFSYLSHIFGNKGGLQEEWPNTFDDPGTSQDQTQDMAAYGDGRFLVVGNNGYMRYHDGSSWQFAIENLPGNEASRTFTGVWIGADVVIVTAWRVSGAQRVLELWTTPKSASPENPDSWTVHTLDTVYGNQAGLFDVWGLEDGSVMLVGSGRQSWNGFQQGLIYSRQ